MAAPKTSIVPKPRPRTKTKEKTLRGRPVWIDHTGEVTGKKGTKYSEITTTIPWGTEWITAPSVDKNGKRLSDDEVKQKLIDTLGKDFITGEKLPTFSSPEKASEYAQWRSDTMFDQEAIEQGFPEEFPMGPEPKRKDFIDRSIDKGKDFLEYLTTPSKHGVFNEGGDVGLPSNRLVYDVDDITRRGPEGKIKRDAAKKRVLEKYNLEGARSDWKVSSSKLGTILANLPTNVRLLTEFMLGKDKPISINDFTKDELASIIALSEEQQENYKNVQNRKLKNQPENVTTVDGYDTTQPYRFSKWIENSPYFRTLAFTLTDPNYQTRTTLGRYDTEETPSSIIIKDAYDMNIKQRDLPNPFGGREELSKVLEEVRSNPEVAGEFLANIIKPNPEDSRKFDLVIPKRKPDQPSPRDTAYQAPMQLKEKPKDNPRIKEEVPEGFDILKFDKGGDVAAQMDLMLPSADDDIRPEDYPQYKPDDFTGRSFAADSFQETKNRFMDAGKIDVDPDDPAIFTAYKRAVDYLKDTGLAGLGLADTAFKYAVGSVAQVMPTEQLEKRMARDLYSMPEAFGGAAGAKSITQLDDAADAFLEGSRQIAQKLKTEYDPTMVRSFVGATPPTYQKREAPLFSLSTSPDEVSNIYNLKSLMFKEPIAEFAKTVNIPKKGLLGSEFLNQIKKNPSIPETSIQGEIIDPSKRYTRDELLDVVEGRGISQSFANIAENKVTQYEQYQRQRRDAGFVGGTELSYFDIPVVSSIGFPGKKFKAHSQHYEDGTLVHVRGSIIDSSVPYSEFNTGPNGEIVIDSTSNFIGFDNIIDKDPYLLVEEIQSDLLTKGYAKPKSPFDRAFNMSANETMAGAEVTFDEAYGDLSNELRQLFKNLDEKNISFPKEPVRLQLPFKTGVLDHPQFKSRVREDFLTELRSPERGTVDDVSYIDFEEIKDYIDKQGVSSNHIYQILNDIAKNSNVFGYLNRFESIGFVDANGKSYEDIIVKVPHPEENNGRYIVDTDSPGFAQFIESFDEYTKQFGLNSDDLLYKYEDEIDQYYDVINKEVQARGLDKEVDGSFVTGMYERYSEIRNLLSETGDEKVGLPPIRKNKQAVDEALKVLIAKAAQQGVDKIVIPPAERIAMARGRELKKDKGDRFYRTYVTDLNKSLKELEDNYPVIVHRDVELPYLSKTDVEDGDPLEVEFDANILDNDDVPLEDIQDLMDMEDILQAQTDAQDIANIVNPTAEITEPLGDELLPPSKRKKLVKTDNKGIILDISKLVNEYKIEQPRQFAEGGVAMNEQMEMAFMQQGGLKDDGMKRDPVSGNEVPNGSMAKEVRDDIPAQLSEGEYVVPADVVRYLGVKHFEDLRTKAKEGLQSMEANGRIGGEPVPVGGPKAMQQPQQMQAPTPYSPPPAPMPPQPRQMAMGGDLTPAEMQEINNIMMNQGGMVAGAANGADFSFYNPPEGVSVEEAITTPGRPGGGRYTGEFSFEQPPAPIATVPAPAPAPTGETPQTCAARGMVYNPETKMCEMPAPTPRVGGDGSSKDEDKTTADPNAWMDNYNYTDVQSILDSSTKALEGPESGTFGALVNRVFGGGIFGVLGQAGTAAQIAANVKILESIGATEEAATLKGKLDGFIKSNDLGWIPGFMIDGDQLAAGATSKLNIENLTEHYGAQKRMDKATTAAFGAARAKELSEKYGGTVSKDPHKDTGSGFYSGYLGAMTDTEREKLTEELNKAAEEKQKAAKAAAAAKKVKNSSGSSSDDSYSAADMMKDRLDRMAKAQGQSEGFSGSTTSGAVYAGGNRAEGGLMLKKKKRKK